MLLIANHFFSPPDIRHLPAALAVGKPVSRENPAAGAAPFPLAKIGSTACSSSTIARVLAQNKMRFQGLNLSKFIATHCDKGKEREFDRFGELSVTVSLPKQGLLG
jgi:hypothetical protein